MFLNDWRWVLKEPHPLDGWEGLEIGQSGEGGASSTCGPEHPLGESGGE